MSKAGLFSKTTIVPVVLGNGGRVPPKAVIDNDTVGSVEAGPETLFDPAEDGVDFYESLEGMLVQVNNVRVIVPSSISLHPNGRLPFAFVD